MRVADLRGQDRPAALDIVMGAGLCLFLALLPFHLVIKWLVPGFFGTYWKEALLGVLVLLWLFACIRARRLLLTHTALDWAVAGWVGFLLLRFLIDRNWGPGMWGLYYSVLYLPVFWVAAFLLRRQPGWLRPLLALLTALGAIVAAGGLLEFALDAPLWPLPDTLGRQGGASSIFVYATHIRRVSFTFDSPTTLANTLALLLPPAVALVLVSRQWASRLAAGLAASLMAACIVVTFSRGVWVATAVSLLLMGVVGTLFRARRDEARAASWKPLLLALGALVVLAASWGLVMRSKGSSSLSTHQGVVELSAEAYRSAPVIAVGRDLLADDPAQGAKELQTWTLVDPISGQEDSRLLLYQHPFQTGRSEILYAVQVPEGGALRFGIALFPEVWAANKGDGVSFEVYAAEAGPGRPAEALFVRYIDPKNVPSDRRWRNYFVDLSPWSGREVILSLITSPGRAGDFAFDWAGWSDLQIVSVEQGFFAGAENAVLRHTLSIADWVEDETNRDRLLAWRLSIDAWRAHPLWGSGLGTTGAAALRTRPSGAFVTESQVLKALVELGPLGLLAFALLWFQIARVGRRALASAGPQSRALLLGILASLLIVFIEGLVYQNLEVKQVSAYFWTLVGCLAVLARQGIHGAQREE